ncbi:MAG: hypothetical protein AMXMBFR44_3470 [Candidatus Campbellbacteria bacterium]
MQNIFPFSFPTTFSPVILWVVFTLVVLAWVAASGILWFHWRAYGSQTKRVKRMKRVYLVGSLLLLALAMSFIFSL